MQTCSVGCKLAIGSGDTACAHVWKLGEFRGTSAHFSRRTLFSRTEVFLKEVHCIMPFYAFYASHTISSHLQTLLNVLMHADLFSGMYTCHWIRWYTCAHVWKLGEFRGTSAHFQTHFQSPSEAVTLCTLLCSFALSHDEQTFLNVLMHADLFSGMYTCQGSGDILVRMCGRWENFVVHLRTFRAFSGPKWSSDYASFNSFAPLTRPAVHFAEMF